MCTSLKNVYIYCTLLHYTTLYRLCDVDLTNLIETPFDGVLHHIDHPLSGATLLGQVGRALRERFLEK